MLLKFENLEQLNTRLNARKTFLQGDFCKTVQTDIIGKVDAEKTYYESLQSDNTAYLKSNAFGTLHGKLNTVQNNHVTAILMGDYDNKSGKEINEAYRSKVQETLKAELKPENAYHKWRQPVRALVKALLVTLMAIPTLGTAFLFKSCRDAFFCRPRSQAVMDDFEHKAATIPVCA